MTMMTMNDHRVVAPCFICSVMFNDDHDNDHTKNYIIFMCYCLMVAAVPQKMHTNRNTNIYDNAKE